MTSDKHILSYNSVATNKTMKGEYEIFTKTMIICALAKYYSYLKDLKNFQPQKEHSNSSFFCSVLESQLFLVDKKVNYWYVCFDFYEYAVICYEAPDVNGKL